VAVAKETLETPARTGGPSRMRGILAAAAAILVVVLALILSRLDLANEVSVVRSQLRAANQELAEDQVEIDELEDAARDRSEGLAACRDSAELGEQVRQALEILQRGLEGGDEAAIAQGVAKAVALEPQWSEANERCLQATQEEEGQG
jgi:hypothetical protein